MKDESLERFLESVAAPTPTPGGGSASAIAGALSAALVRMVAGLARGKAGYESVQADIERIEREASAIQARLLALAEEDTNAYDGVIAALKLPRGTETERLTRVGAMQEAYKKAAEVPLRTIEACVEALHLAAEAVHHGNRSATTDAGVALLLAEAAVRGAALNVRTNVAAIRDESFRDATEGRLGALLTQADRIGHEAMKVVEGRL